MTADTIPGGTCTIAGTPAAGETVTCVVADLPALLQQLPVEYTRTIALQRSAVDECGEERLHGGWEPGGHVL